MGGGTGKEDIFVKITSRESSVCLNSSLNGKTLAKRADLAL